jgi:uncharacterized protein (TIGR02391 family)
MIYLCGMEVRNNKPFVVSVKSSYGETWYHNEIGIDLLKKLITAWKIGESSYFLTGKKYPLDENYEIQIYQITDHSGYISRVASQTLYKYDINSNPYIEDKTLRLIGENQTDLYLDCEFAFENPFKAFIASSERLSNKNQLKNLHQKVIEASSKQFNDGHFKNSILDSFIVLQNYIRDKAWQEEKLDGKGLMTTVFSSQRPILRISSNNTEQEGYMNLFVGSILALRNNVAHRNEYNGDAMETLEILTYISYLFRLVDRAEYINQDVI